MKHGGDILSYQHLYDGSILDFSSNINPLGYPGILDKIMANGLACLTAYPDMQYRALRQATADYLGCQPDEVIVGNGAVEIIDAFCRKFPRVVTCVPCFAEYLERPAVYQHQINTLRLPGDFRLSASLFKDQIQPGDLIILGNPNNPTGQRIEKAELLRIQALAEEHGAFFLLDEAFFEFCPEDYDSIQLFYGKENVCIIRAATKFFGLPGLRLGYAYAPRTIVEEYDASALPWRINALADLAGRVIFQDAGYIQRTKQYIERQRQFMLSELRTIEGIIVYPTDTNFILLKLLYCTEHDVFTQLIRQGLLIRKASSFAGLDDTYIRVAVKDQTSNEKLIDALRHLEFLL